MKVKAVLEVLQEEDDQYLTSVDRFRLAQEAISQLLSQIRELLGIDKWDLHLIVQSQSSRWMRIAMGDEAEDGTDLAKAKREAARRALFGTKGTP